MPNVRSKPAITNSSSSRTSLFRGPLRGVELFGIELAQHFEFLIGRRLGHAQVVGELQEKSRVVLKLLAVDAGIERQHLHAPPLGFESEYRQIGDHAEHAAGEEPAC